MAGSPPPAGRWAFRRLGSDNAQTVTTNSIRPIANSPSVTQYKYVVSLPGVSSFRTQYFTFSKRHHVSGELFYVGSPPPRIHRQTPSMGSPSWLSCCPSLSIVV